MTQNSFEEFQTAYKMLDLYQQRWLRDAARRELMEQGNPEMGSLDVGCKMHDMYQRYGSFNALLEYLIEMSV